MAQPDPWFSTTRVTHSKSTHPKDIYLIGQEAADIDGGPTMQSLSLKDLLGELRKISGLKLVFSRDAAELDHILTYFGSYSQQMGRMMVLEGGGPHSGRRLRHHQR